MSPDTKRSCGCPEQIMLSRRSAVAGITASLFSTAFLPRGASAAGVADPRLLVVVLRGGMDGVNVCVPFGDSSYVSMRGAIAIPASSTIRLDGFFGLHPALVNFASYYKAGDAAVIHATAVPLHTRSHFDCQDNLENGMPGSVVPSSTGWLNRLLSALPNGSRITSQGAIEVGTTPLILRGPAPVLGWSPTPFRDLNPSTLTALQTLYAQRDPELGTLLQRGLEADALANGVNTDGLTPLRAGFRGAGSLLAADAGPRIAVLSVGGWDTHDNQGGATGALADTLTELDTALADFRQSIGDVWGSTAVVMATEFGRTVHVNGDRGTDHGVGTVTLLAGGAVRGGGVYGDWPGLSQSRLLDSSDLKPTTDLRAVFKGVLRDHLGVGSSILNGVFPSSSSVTPLSGLMKSASGAAMPAAALAPQRVEPPIARYRRLNAG